MSINTPVLVLNQNYQPLNVCNASRAIVLLDMGKAEEIIDGQEFLRTVTKHISIPSVIRLVYMVKRPLVKRRLSRRAIFYRDGFKCQYCGLESKNLTLDHILPRSRGGPHVWENVVSACIPCNHKKARSTPSEAGMYLISEPKTPRPNPYYMFHNRTLLDEWKQFMPWMT